MKSLALHLLAFLLLGALRIAPQHRQFLSLSTAAAASTVVAGVETASVRSIVSTTTIQPPSLRAPQQAPATTKMTTATRMPNTPTTRAQPTTKRTSRATAQANGMMTMMETRALSAPTLVRHINNNSTGSHSNDSKTVNGASVRQNRSLSNIVAASSTFNNESWQTRKHAEVSRMQQQQQQQKQQQNHDDDNNNNSNNKLLVSASNASASFSAAQHQTKLPAFMANHRQSHQWPKSTDEPVPLHASTTTTTTATNSTTSSTQQQQQTLKTPRMIQRLVAGHIQNAEGHSTYEVSVVSANSSVSHSNVNTTDGLSPLYYRRKQPVLSSSFRSKKPTTTASPAPLTTTTVKSYKTENTVDFYDDRDDDAALLDDVGDFDNWDNGILRLSAGSGKENSKSKKPQDDSKKTLADQVKDGKYGLIENELFRREPKRPGVVSYSSNKEVPVDSEHNYGGLNEEDIWLAEDHLLVIKGGKLNDGDAHESWPPIDDYDAPGRQIKIPPNPKVPPPFPVQLEEGGPVQFIGNNKFTVVYPVANESIPVYPGGIEANYPPSEGDSDDEKNLLTRPGSPQDVTYDDPRPGQDPGTLYPPSYPSWLFHNQTFVNPFLKNTRPITFTGLGPYPFGRVNGSLENSNVTEDFDEDDPSLYYPPAYSFIYKNNYSNPVPPGPLVPGIVLPPPSNQFSRLEKPNKSKVGPISPPRHRPYTTTSTSTTTTTTTTTTSTTTPRPPFREVITKISEYTPKTILITPDTPKSVPKLPPTPPPSPPTPILPPPDIIAPVPVPVAVPVPIYPSKNFPTSRPNALPYIPTSPEPVIDTFSKSNPIYYEYFDAKRQPNKPNAIDDYRTTTPRLPVTSKPIKIYANNKRPFKSQSHRNYLQPLPPQRAYLPENIVYITPKPETRYQVPVRVPVYKPRPLENFEREVNAIRETLRYYQNQQLRDNTIPRTPKAKPIYEYSFDASKNLQPDPGNFQPPAEFDEEPFKPMVTYSPPVDDENAFHAIAFDKVDGDELQQQKQQQQQQRYQSTTTLVPVDPQQSYQEQELRPKKQRLGAKYLQQSQIGAYQQQLQQQSPIEIDYQSTPRTVLTTQAPWILLDNQEFNDYRAPQAPLRTQQQQQQQYQSERLQLPPAVVNVPKQRLVPGGYYYRRPSANGRQNNRFYDEPFQNSDRKIVNYRPPQVPVQQQQQQQQVWSLENDTYVNYAPNRPPLNPDAEFIDPYQTIPVNPYAQQGQRFAPLPAISHQAQYYAPPQRLPQPVRQQQQHQPVSLHRDVLVNYRPPLPPINPDSEFISHPHVVRNQPQPYYRNNVYRPQLAPPEAAFPPAFRDNNGQQGNLYYITPKYRRANNANNERNNNNGNIESNRERENNGK